MGNSELKAIRQAAQNGEAISGELAIHVLGASPTDLPEIFAAASSRPPPLFRKLGRALFDL